jgi:hypothetical protein
MQTNPLEQWQSLTALYGEMGDLEIHELAANIGDLTEVAQQVLREEIKKRGLQEKPAAAVRTGAPVFRDSGLPDYVDLNSEDADADQDEDHALDYTWKTVLCNCESLDEAAMRSEMLRRARIENWIERRGSRHSIPWVDELGVGDIQILVAADQLEQARIIAAQPIPIEILEESKTAEEVTEYVAPKCPSCGAEDPILESADPFNSWECESCGKKWTETIDGVGSDSK